MEGESRLRDKISRLCPVLSEKLKLLSALPTIA